MMRVAFFTRHRRAERPGSRALWREITWLLLFKAAALTGLWYAFFHADGRAPVTPAQAGCAVLDRAPASPDSCAERSP